MKGYIVSSDNTLVDNKTCIQLFGRLENGQSFASIHELNPYFFIEEKKLKKADKYLKKYSVEKTKLTTFSGKPVAKISSSNHIELSKLSQALHKLDIDTYEADVKPYYRFIIDNDLLGNIDISGDYESSEKIDRIYKNPEIKPSSEKINLKIISLDTESDKDSGKLYCIGMYSPGYQKNFMVTDKKLEHTISCKTEADCLEAWKKELIKIDPDIIVGWNVIDFDLKYLQDLFKKHKIQFDIGRDNNSARLKIEDNFFRSSKADIPGRQILDGINLLRDPFIKEAPSIKNAEFESYTLEDVSQAILKTGKLIKGKGRHEEISKIYKTDQQKLVNYNLMDCKLAYDIIEKTKMIELALERSSLTGIPLDKITASIIAFDSLYIREARKRGLVSPTTHYGLKEEKIKGGYVYASKPGIYHNVLIFDYKSMYPSIIRTFNIDPYSFLEKKEKNCIVSPNGAHFKNQSGILPQIIETLHHAREKAKKENRELANYAIKIIMNSFFGVLASPNCRYFNFDMANAITHFARHFIQLTAKEIEKSDYKVIYSDTDSVFVETQLEKNKANILGNKIQDNINKLYDEHIKEEYNRKSFMELQFAKQYLSLMIPSTRKQEKDEEKKAAKKRYAGLIEKDGKEVLEIVGLEAIRGDWTDAAQEFQRELLTKIFHKESPESFIKNYIKKVKSGELDSKLIYSKSIRKDLKEYTKTTPPHVKAARLLDSLESNVIQYYITTAGPEPIQKHKHPLDYDHYIKKQIEPIANQVLSLFSKKMEDIINNSKQSKLF